MGLRRFFVRRLAFFAVTLLFVTGTRTPSFAAEPDTSVPLSLVSMRRSSGDVVRHGDQVLIDWEVQGSAASNVIFYLRDRYGALHQVRWDGLDGASAYSGTAALVMNEAVMAAGDLVLVGFGAGNAYASTCYDVDGRAESYPQGLPAPVFASFDHKQISSHSSPHIPLQVWRRAQGNHNRVRLQQ